MGRGGNQQNTCRPWNTTPKKTPGVTAADVLGSDAPPPYATWRYSNLVALGIVEPKPPETTETQDTSRNEDINVAEVSSSSNPTDMLLGPLFELNEALASQRKTMETDDSTQGPDLA
ncbi:1275_t:CDS:2 [Paraglomus brasilianum]|uniref:1275_t:CDS:1 n=1 Tax=Paraglomus brasilianum TaxID=144538 RepID=A0A9N9B6N4_9GLOM|nr:1275_t:CDS:2 [Paraglomus brasilianum]